MISTRLLSATALVTSLLVVPAAAFAQAAPNAANPTPAQPSESAITQEEEAKTSAASADGETRGDGTIIVTGSRIPRPERDGTIPGVQIGQQQIEQRGFTNALEALNDIPLVGPGASPLTGNNGGQAASLGAAFPDLLDLGTQRTLTLINGRRFVSGNSASLFVEGNATGSQVDINVIPTTLIQRVDVLTVGGASAYGADAVAGVVNFILRDDFTGLTVRALSGITERGDAAQYQLAGTYGLNFAGDRGNVVVSGEYTRNEGLQADSRDFRLARTNSYTNPFNGSRRNSAFASAIIDPTNSNNGAFLRATDDGIPATLFGAGFINQSLSFNGTVTNAITTPYTPYVPITNTGTPAGTVTSNFISFNNGLAPVGVVVPGTTAAGATSLFGTRNVGFYSTTGQIIQGTPGVGYAGNALVNGSTYTLAADGRNGRAAPAAGLTFTTFAPTALVGATAAAQATYADSVLTGFGVTPPTGATRAQLNTLAINVLQANRFTAREFYAANPNVNVNYFIGTFVPSIPKIANTDTTLVTVRNSQGGGTVQVPVNQVLPFVAVPLEFNPDGTLRTYTFASGTTPTSPLTVGQAQGSNGGFARSIENTVLRTQQDRYVANLIGHFDINEELTFFTENTYANVTSRSRRNSPSQNFQSNTAENAPLQINVNNPYLSAQNLAVLGSVGINATNNPTFIVTRQNQDIFGENPSVQRNETFRVLGGLRSKFQLLNHDWNAEISGTYGRAKTRTATTQINDIEYQLALDSVVNPATGQIVCRSQLFPSQYVGRSPVGVAPNIVRQRNAAGELAESLFTPTITQAMIDSCQPLNPFGYNNMSEGSKNYVRQNVVFQNISEQTLITASFGGGVFDLPAGTLAFNINGEYRKDKLRFTSDPLNQFGRGRAAPSSNFGAFTETYEIGGEASIPLTGPDFLPFLGRLQFSPGFRVVQQSGSADSYRNTAGRLIAPRSVGDPQTIYSLAGTWAPIRDISFRGNYTKSVRQPSVTELFLGGQPVFSTPTDFCSQANLSTTAPAQRRANCRTAVIGAGLATDPTSADTFLATYVPLGVGLSGTYAGNTELSPEKATSWTAGGVLTPRWIPGLVITGDYISVNLRQTIVPTTLAQGIQSCYDSPTFPDTSAQTGTNLCNSFTRDASFQIANGYALSFLNLGGIRVKAINATATYPIGLGNLGKLTLRGSAYRLIRYETSASGTFSVNDATRSDGRIDRPKLETQLNGRYEKGAFYVTGTWNRRAPTNILTGVPAVQAGIEVYPVNKYPAINTYDAAIGADVTEDFRLQLSAINLGDKNYAGDLGYLFQDYIDQIGRRFQVTAIAKF